MSWSTTRKHFAYNFYVLAWTGLDLLFPPDCGGCRKPGIRWCDQCESTTTKLPETVCKCCGKAISYFGICPDCEARHPPFHEVRSWAYLEGPLREAVHQLKYRGDVGLGEIFARPLIKLLMNLDWDPELILPVPLSKNRFIERGYNQAALIARPIALAQGIKYSNKSLRKIRETSSQVGLNFSDRLKNVTGVFSADKNGILNKKVLIVDDVFTSGATIQACSQALLAAGATCVFGLTLARSTFEMDQNFVQTKN